MRGSERPRIEADREARRTSPLDYADVLIWALALLAAIAALLFWTFGFTLDGG